MRALVSWCALLLLCHLHRGILGGPSSTSLSGFGARSIRNTIFPYNQYGNNATQTSQSRAKAFFARDRQLHAEEPKLWAKLCKEPESLLLQFRDADNTTIHTLQISVVDQSGDWKVTELSHAAKESKGEWIPIEGIYGMYKLPSGIMWVLVTKTDNVYSAPSLQDEVSTQWWQIRKVRNLELVHLSRPGIRMSTGQLREEVRQLRLLRQSLKEHEFYFVPQWEGGVVKHMTANLQESFQKYLAGNGTTKWWDSRDHRPDPRFFWNEAAVEPILQRYASHVDNPSQKSLLSMLLHHTVILSSAFVGIQSNVTDPSTGSHYDQILISRRSRFRAGTRFTRRGADSTGAVANFAETEQICLVLNGTQLQHVMSHLQTRGSIPLRWSSPTDVKTYRPRVRIGTDPLAQARALRLHLLEQFSHYVAHDTGHRLSHQRNSSMVPKLVFVNLIDKKKDQGRLGKAFDAALTAVMDVYALPQQEQEEPPPRLYDLHSSSLKKPENNKKPEEELLGDRTSVKHLWFDFHAEVKNGRWDRLINLLNDVQPALLDHGFFLIQAPNSTSTWTIQSLQKAIVRTNCMDCLDRTNVVQSLFGRFILFQQLHQVGTQESRNETISVWEKHSLEYAKSPSSIPWDEGENAHRLLWADNADAISRLYAGTPALKGDFTRTGTRTRRGALDDGVNSLQRYYLNNFLDADRQEGMDLLVGYLDFTDVDSSSVRTDRDDQGGDETTYISIKQAARENFFGKLVGSLEEEKLAEIQEQLGVSDREAALQSLEAQQDVALRWLPGDLHGHMKSNVELLLRGVSSKENDTTSFEFSTSKSLASIERRSASDAPWWADVDEAATHRDGADQKVAANAILAESAMITKDLGSLVNADLPNIHRAPQLARSQLLGVVLFGLQAPRRLAMFVVLILGLTILPDILTHDLWPTSP